MSSDAKDTTTSSHHTSSPQMIRSSWSSSCTWPQLLPIELYREIKEWLQEKDYFDFLNTSQKYNEVKFMTRRITLSESEFMEFVANEEFRERILSKIADPYYQLTLVILPFTESVNWEVLKDIKCSLVNRSNSFPLQERYNLLEEREYISYATRRPFPENTVISNVKKLSLHIAFPFVLVNISTLTLYRCDLKDGLHSLHSCGQLIELSLNSCTGVKSLTGLELISASLSSLALMSLNELSDISVLSVLRLRKCEVRNCSCIEDYRPLISSGIKFILMHPVGMRTLKYSNIRPSTRSLFLTDLHMFSVPVSFSSLHFLHFENCDTLIHLSNTLYHIPFLAIAYCKFLSDISGLGGHQCIEVRVCEGITDFSSLKKVPTVSITCCDGFTCGSHVENVKHLTIENCGNFHDPSTLGKIHHLELIRLSLKSLAGLYSVPTISLCDLTLQGGFQGLGGNRRVKLIRRVLYVEDLEGILLLFPIDRYDHEYFTRELIIYAKN